MRYSSIAVIYNPNSTGSSKSVAETFKKNVLARLPDQKIELFATEHAGHAEELAYSLAKVSTNALIISSSGDGGYNEVVNGAMKAQNQGYKVTTGLLPAGNANDHYRNLHKGNIIDFIEKGESRSIDLLKIKSKSGRKTFERYAHSYIGLGLTPEVGQELNKTKLSLGKEVWLVAKVLLASKPVRLKIKRRAGYYESIVFSNVDSMSKYLKISHPSSVTDGKFEVTVFERRGRWKLISDLLRATVVSAKEDECTSRFTLKTIDKTLVQVDGEVAMLNARARVVVTAEKQVLRCVV